MYCIKRELQKWNKKEIRFKDQNQVCKLFRVCSYLERRTHKVCSRFCEIQLYICKDLAFLLCVHIKKRQPLVYKVCHVSNLPHFANEFTLRFASLSAMRSSLYSHHNAMAFIEDFSLDFKIIFTDRSREPKIDKFQF